MKAVSPNPFPLSLTKIPPENPGRAGPFDFMRIPFRFNRKQRSCGRLGLTEERSPGPWAKVPVNTPLPPRKTGQIPPYP